MAYLLTAVITLGAVLTANWLNMKLKFAQDEQAHKKTLQLFLVRLFLILGCCFAAYSFASAALSKDPLTRIEVASMVLNGVILPMGLMTFIMGQVVAVSVATRTFAESTTKTLTAMHSRYERELKTRKD